MSAVTTRTNASKGLRHSRRAPGTNQSRTGYLFIAPFIVLFATLFIVPLLYAAYFSLFKQQIVGGSTFAGLENYARALRDPLLLDGVWKVAQFFVLQVPVMLVLALAAALAIDSGLLRASKVFRLGVFVPYAVPSVVAALMWGYLYGRDFGPFAQLAQTLGFQSPDFLSAGFVLPSLANIVTWSLTGYNMIILYAALRAIPTDLYEAAAMDGAGPWRVAWSIKIPALRPALVLCLIFSVIGAFQLFAEPNLIQRLAPSVISSSFTPNLYAYTLAFTGQQVNYAAAVSFLLGLIIVVVSFFVLFLTNRKARS
ncbi:carbohydrate ABC transporter permease [Rathayibacter sp. AY2B7]|uniref:carbohydrate ABC transporter permease n=1 Tax=Rathayibacter sp. AY2B7 TaxID=2080571 RepID=UPI0021581E5C|nr:sugar ABC transporter permease [Rathayibacter sp. AY2B7]